MESGESEQSHDIKSSEEAEAAEVEDVEVEMDEDLVKVRGGRATIALDGQLLRGTR